MRTIHEEAVEAAIKAAEGTARTGLWEQGDTDFVEVGDELVRFILDNPTAPPEATYITAGRLGLHDGKPWPDITPQERLGYQVFISVFLNVSDALDAAAAEMAAEEAAEDARVAAEGQKRIGGIPEDELEGTPFERVADPLALSEFGKVAAERKRLDEERAEHEARVRDFEEKQAAAEAERIAAKATSETHEVVVVPRVDHAEMAPPVEPQPEAEADAPEAAPAKAKGKGTRLTR